MTKKESLLTLREFVETAYAEDNQKDLLDFLDRELELLDKRAQTAKAAAEKKKAEGDELSEEIYGLLTDDFQTIGDITEAIGREDVTVAKVTYRISKLAKDGRAEKGAISIEQEDAKPRKVVAYKKA